jgi:ribosomal protein S18 acetylase RimI-like enzyme
MAVMTHLDEIRARLERYYDGVPRTAARAEDFGSLTLFVRNDPAGYPYYGRPTLGGTEPVTPTDVQAVLARQRELGLPQSFEWVEEITPSLEGALAGTGLGVHRHPLMVHDGQERPTPPLAAGVQVSVLGADDPLLASARTVPNLAFAEPGTALGQADRRELEQAAEVALHDGSVDRLAERIRSGLSAVVAVHDGALTLSSGQHNPLGDTTEIVGVGTLPAARRQGLAAAVTAGLLADAREHGATTVFLSAGDDDVARIYGRLGFTTVGTALIAEPAEG